jgi:hypothetical protein
VHRLGSLRHDSEEIVFTLFDDCNSTCRIMEGKLAHLAADGLGSGSWREAADSHRIDYEG